MPELISYDFRYLWIRRNGLPDLHEHLLTPDTSNAHLERSTLFPAQILAQSAQFFDIEIGRQWGVERQWTEGRKHECECEEQACAEVLENMVVKGHD